ncbi:hypothetical protein FEM48_Zijuj08G0173400 [Ziziphus jujuba var. spinosa]|uniref:Stress enhanced protein 2, chloroplastic n=1 Tax=Ziziphus jujuba var. spinosa TaxID=714518 RepID=A0A978V0D8_ZIZJJ|nr:hypothetical protein FEM48_Zijuj08G0173400 [Ziziphus jujuba var. spinosa]
MATVARAIRCELRVPRPASQRIEPEIPVQIPFPKVSSPESENNKIMLQPRLCTLRSYGSDRLTVMKTKKDGGDEAASLFFATLSEYIENSKKSQDFEIISGRLAMIVFAATVTEEIVTGNSLFRKMDMEGIEEALGACLAAVTCAAIFAWFSSARTRVGKMFSVTCNSFIDTLIDQIVDGLFYDTKLDDWSDDK